MRVFNLNNQTGQCPICSQINPILIKTPTDLSTCIEMMKELVGQDGFEKVSSNFELEHPKTPAGYWKDDVMHYAIRCKSCGQIYSCVCDTYHGNGRFDKGT